VLDPIEPLLGIAQAGVDVLRLYGPRRSLTDRGVDEAIEALDDRVLALDERVLALDERVLAVFEVLEAQMHELEELRGCRQRALDPEERRVRLSLTFLESCEALIGRVGHHP
jgi:hypothetical protein